MGSPSPLSCKITEQHSVGHPQTVLLELQPSESLSEPPLTERIIWTVTDWLACDYLPHGALNHPVIGSSAVNYLSDWTCRPTSTRRQLWRISERDFAPQLRSSSGFLP